MLNSTVNRRRNPTGNFFDSDYFTENFQVKENKTKIKNIHPRFFHLLFLRLIINATYGIYRFNLQIIQMPSQLKKKRGCLSGFDDNVTG